MKNRPIKIIKANQAKAKIQPAQKKPAKIVKETALPEKIAQNINSWVEESRRTKDSLRLLALKGFENLTAESNMDFA